MKRQVYLFAFMLLWLGHAREARAADPRTQISQYGHVVWRIGDNLLNAAPNAIAQTPDGYIWIGTETGLLRFDGVRFVQWEPPHWAELGAHEVDVLYVASDGALWVGTPTNLATWKNGVLNVVDTDGPVYVNRIVEDREHTTWFTTTRRHDRKGLCRVSEGVTKCFGPTDGLPVPFGTALAANTDGSLSLTSEGTLFTWSSKTGLLSTSGPARRIASVPVPTTSLIENQADGSKLIGFIAPGAQLGLQRVVGSSWSPFTQPGLDGSTLSIQSLHIDRAGSMWIGSRTSGLYRISGKSVDHYDKRAGLSGNSVQDIYEDHEGNLWVATEGGMDQFRDLKVVTWSTDQGLPAGYVYSVLATNDNGVLLGIDQILSVLRDGKIAPLSSEAGTPNTFVGGMLEDSLGRYWVGLNNDLVVYDKQRLTVVKRPDGRPVGKVFSLALAPDDSVWALVFNQKLPRELLHFKSDKMIGAVSGDGLGLKVVSDHAGGVWINGQGLIGHYVNGKLSLFPLTAQPDAKNFSVQDDLVVSADGTVSISSRLGVWVVKEGKARLIDTAAGLPCPDVNGLVLSREQSLWMRTTCGLVEIGAGAIDAWWFHSEKKISYRLIDSSEGARPSRTVLFPQMSLAPDGRIWVGIDFGVQVVDPSHIPFNQLPPPVHIEEVVADHDSLKPTTDLKLRPLTRDLEVQYTALSFAAPEDIKFRYMLEGRDSTWQDPGTRRSAFYNDLKPGHYRFRVIAANNDGVWNNTGDSLSFSVKPAWFQTSWFRMCALALALGAIWIFYRWRVKTVADAMNARFSERLDERTRLAREIHDTLLQTLQGSKIVADSARDPGADEERMRGALDKVSGWLEQAITEGREAVHALRASTLEHEEIADYLDKTLRDQCGGTALTADVSVIGDQRNLHPIVRDEFSLIAREAIRNVCLHSKATELRLEIHFAEHFCLSVKDNGVGIAPEIVNLGKDGHFGLQSMRERSARIHADFDIRDVRPHGTEVWLRIPGAVAYKRDDQTEKSNILRFFGI